jgi:hypothetical protein
MDFETLTNTAQHDFAVLLVAITFYFITVARKVFVPK